MQALLQDLPQFTLQCHSSGKNVCMYSEAFLPMLRSHKDAPAWVPSLQDAHHLLVGAELEGLVVGLGLLELLLEDTSSNS